MKLKLAELVALAVCCAAVPVSLALSPGTTIVAGQQDLAMQQIAADGSICDSTNLDDAQHCAQLGAYGPGLQPGQPTSTTITIRNSGTVTPGLFTLTAGACNNPALCEHLQLTLTQDGRTITTASPAQLAAAPTSLTAPAPGRDTRIELTVQLLPDADPVLGVQTAGQNLTWTFTP